MGETEHEPWSVRFEFLNVRVELLVAKGESDGVGWW